MFIHQIGRDRHQLAVLRLRLGLPTGLGQCAGKKQTGGAGLNGVVGRLACLAEQIRSPGRSHFGKLCEFGQPDSLCERSLLQEVPRVGGSFVVFPGENDLPARDASHQSDARILVRACPKKPGPDGKSGDLSKGGPFQVGGKLLPELPRDAPPLVIEADRSQLTLLDNESQAEADQRGAWQEDCREKEQNLSPVPL